jgi:hypothetical protein
LADIGAFGGFRPDPAGGGYQFGKLFATSAEDAARFGWINVQLGGRPFTLVEATLPAVLVEQFHRDTLDRMPAVMVYVERLAELNAAARIRILSYVPLGGLPWRR